MNPILPIVPTVNFQSITFWYLCKKEIKFNIPSRMKMRKKKRREREKKKGRERGGGRRREKERKRVKINTEFVRRNYLCYFDTLQEKRVFTFSKRTLKEL
uniref:Uncharacterized protein n=1 Tax=Cacopsylla melanoneura TaxID=428564 RepID=A0A8D8ZED0_9HEMI